MRNRNLGGQAQFFYPRRMSERRIPVRLSHLVSPEHTTRDRYALAKTQIDPYLQGTDMITQITVHQLLRNKLYTIQNNEELDFDLVGRPSGWKIEKSAFITRTYTVQDGAVSSSPGQTTAVSWSMKFLCRQHRFSTVVDLFYDCSAVTRQVETMTVRRDWETRTEGEEKLKE
jgi:hypothetical protein